MYKTCKSVSFEPILAKCHLRALAFHKPFLFVGQFSITLIHVFIIIYSKCLTLSLYSILIKSFYFLRNGNYSSCVDDRQEWLK